MSLLKCLNKKSITKGLTLMCAPFLLSYCRPSNGGGGDSQNLLIPKTEYSANVKIVDPSVGQYINSFDGNIIEFTYLPEDFKHSLSRDTILMFMGNENFPKGFLKKVHTINDNTIFTTPSTLQEAIEQGSWNISQNSQGNSMQSNIILPLGNSCQGYNRLLKIDKTILTENNQEIKISGNFCYDFDVVSSGEIKNKKFNKFSTNFNLKNSLEIIIQSNITKEYDKKINLGKVCSLPIITPVGPITPCLNISADLYALLSGETSARIKRIEDMNVELKYENGIWDSQASHNSEFLDTRDSIESSLNAKLKANLNIDFELYFYNVIAPSLGIAPYLELKAESHKYPWLTLSAGFDVNVGVNVAIFGINLVNYNKPIAAFDKILYEKGYPSLIVNFQASRQESAKSFLFDASNSISESPINSCTFEITDGYSQISLNSGPECNANYDFNNIGTFPVKVLVQTSAGDLESKTINIISLEDLTELTSRPSNIYYNHPSFSPDGKRIVYQKDNNGISSLEIIDIAKKEITPIPISGGTLNPNWSSTNRIAYNNNLWTTEIFSINPDGSQLKKVTSNNIFDWSPAWSYDSSEMVIVSATPNKGDHQLYLINANGTNRTQLTNSNSWVGYPDLSKGGEIVFVKQENGENQIHRITKNGGGLTKVVQGENPSWFDNDRILFDDSYIYMINKDGSNKIQLSHFPSMETAPTASPNKEFIAYERSGDIVLQYIPLSIRD